MIQFYLQMIETEEGRSKFRILYEDYDQLMYRAAFSILKQKEDAEDAVQTAYENIARRIDDVDMSIEPKLKAYVVTIAANAAKDIWRKRHRQRLKEVSVTEMDLSDSDEIDLCYAYEGNDTLAKCLATLKPRYREALLLNHYYGYTLKEIAVIMKITNVNAANLVYRARKQVEALYRKENVE